MTVQQCTTEHKRSYTSSPFNTPFILEMNVTRKTNFLPYLGFRQKFLEVPETPFVWVQHSSAKGKQAVLLKSLFKESDCR